MVSIKFNMANPYQNTILLEQAFEEIKEICKKFQNDSGSSNSEFKTLLKEIAIYGIKNNPTNYFCTFNLEPYLNFTI